MRLSIAALLVPCAAGFVQQPGKQTSLTVRSMILEKNANLAKIELLKLESDHLVHPLKEVSLYKMCAASIDTGCW
jgi:hypothetical protein